MPCGECGERASPHFCQPRADEELEFLEALVLVDSVFRGQPLVPIDWVKDVTDMVWGMVIWDEKNGWTRLFQDLVLNIIRGAMKTVFLSSRMLRWLATARSGAVAAFAQQNIEEAMAKLVPMVLDMAEAADILEELDIRWVPPSSHVPGGGSRFTRGKGARRGELVAGVAWHD